MIIIKLWGGLGNQMFQYAYGYALAKKNNDSLYFDVDYFKEQRKGVGKRKVVIDKYFSLSNFEIINRPQNLLNFYENRYVNRIIRMIASGSMLYAGDGCRFFKEPYRLYQTKIPYIEGKKNYYDGYWLTSRYFSEYKKEILKEFTADEECNDIVKDKMASAMLEESVAIHVRRGDYLNTKKANAPGGFDEESLNKYYFKAIRIIMEKVKAPIFYVFSDDLSWCKKNIKIPGSKVHYIENTGKKADLLDLLCISKCKHGIMSPSTFSWWGNWMRIDNVNSVVILPKGNYANNYFAEDNWYLL